jgi:NADH-quinone oxidoreductase subunit L
MQPELLCALIPLFPLIGFLINGIGFRHIPKGLAGVIATGAVLASLVMSVFLFIAFLGSSGQPGNAGPLVATLFDWISIGDLHINFSFQIDQLSLLMLLVITGVGTLIHLYSIGYMKHDEGFGKFMAF